MNRQLRIKEKIEKNMKYNNVISRLTKEPPKLTAAFDRRRVLAKVN